MFFRTLIYSGLAVLLAGVSTSCKREVPVPVNPDELVQLGDISITVQDLEREFELCRKERRPVISEQNLLEKMVEFKAQAERARNMGLDEDPAVQRRIDKILVTALREKECSPKDLKVDEDELKAAYDAEIAKYTRSAMDRFAMLYLELKKNASENKRAEVLKRMEDAREKALLQMKQDGYGLTAQGFGKLSLTCSDDNVSRYRGGDIGWSRRDMPSPRVPADVWEIGLSLEKGGMSEIIETSVGLYLILKTDFRAANVTPYESVRSSILRRITAEKRAAAERDFTKACVEWAAPVRNEERIDNLSKEISMKPEVAGTAMPAMGVPHE